MNDNVRRQTLRKKLISQVITEVFHDQPAVLEELRWRVFQHEMKHTYENVPSVTRSYRNSFARTLREYLPNLWMHKYNSPEGIPAGLVARAVVYRCAEPNTLMQIESSNLVSIFFDLKMPRDVDDNCGEPYISRIQHGEEVTYVDMRKMIYSWVYLGPGGDQRVREKFSEGMYRYESGFTFRACLPCNKAITVVSKSRRKPVPIRSCPSKWQIYRLASNGQLVQIQPDNALNK